ncbi:MAG: SsrA-binding protein SmpB [Acidimicrobiia bacterium]|nr:SsrA-binding protein SmpB [Acidimicrobiia bacterium]
MAPKDPDIVVVATNRVARRDFEILDVYEAGLVLKGSEVKSLRESKVQLNDCYGRIDDGEAWLLGLHIAPYSKSTSEAFGHEPDRHRKLLLHRSEIDRIRPRLDQERLTLVPLRLYFHKGRAKVELAVARGKKSIDRRQEIARRDADLDARREMAKANRRG